jgi:malonate-semialdehyde dehydrogenase (acetylating)/methylmalonate-semialdehyde dehydrogenase
MGPLISSAHRSKVLGYIDSGEAQGAKLRVDGRGFSVKGHEQGYFVGPTLFDNVTPEMTIYKEEIFGPVLSVVRVADYASAVDLINRHEYGNGSAIFTRDGGCARRFCEEVQAGMVGSTCRSRCRWHSTASAAGSVPSLARSTSTATTACASTPE